MLRGFKTLLATLAVAGVAAGVAAAGVTTNDVKQTMPFSVFIPCANGGAGETVSGTIDLHTLFTATVNGNNVSMKEHFQPQGSSLVGETTGDAYQATGVTQDHSKSSLQNGQSTFTFVNNFRIIGQGPGNNFLIHEVTHVTVNANGDITATFDNPSLDCK
jgi:hypothetical protein